MKTKQNDKFKMPDHLKDEDLIAFVDGELEREEYETVRVHLDSCWECRTKLTVFQRGIEKFLKIRQEKLLPPDLPPAGLQRELFRQRLAAYRSTAGAQSFYRKKNQWISRTLS